MDFAKGLATFLLRLFGVLNMPEALPPYSPMVKRNQAASEKLELNAPRTLATIFPDCSIRGNLNIEGD